MITFRHSGVYVKDLKSLKKFYKSIFNLSEVVHQIEDGPFIETLLGIENIAIDVCKMKFEDGIILELIEVQGESGNLEDLPLTKLGRQHIAVTVSSADEIYEKIRINGGTFISKPKINTSGNAKVFFARDLEGNHIEVVEEL